LTVPNERGQVVPFRLYPQQKLMLSEHTGRDVTVKARQTRASSLILARNVRRLTTGFGLKGLVVTQDDQTTKLFRDRIRQHLQDLKEHGLDYPLVADNKDEIVIGKDMQNHVLFGSSEERVVGRSYAAQVVHLSEVAHWRPETAGELIGAITPAVPGAPDGWIDMESTPNGAVGIFYDYAQDAQDESDPMQRWRLHFYSWWLESRYRAGAIGEVDCDFQLPPGELADLVERFQPDRSEQILMEEHHLTIPQILWRRWRERELLKTGVPFKQEYIEDLEGCFITGQGNFFSSPDGIDHLAYYKSQTADPAFRLDTLPYGNSGVLFYGPNLSIWERPDPMQKYVGYLDCAEGGLSRESDFSAFVILNAYTRHHAATLRLKAAPSELGAMVCSVGQYYNQALIGGERGTYGSAALERIRDLRYKNIYYHVDLRNPRKEPEPWIYPTQGNRDEILRVFREAVFERTFLTRDATLVGEMGSFSWEKVRDNQLKAKAKKRKHDDVVIAAAGATYLSNRYSRHRMERPEERPQEELLLGPGGIVLHRGPALSSGPMPWMR